MCKQHNFIISEKKKKTLETGVYLKYCIDMTAFQKL